jgi:hypothetical protein
MLKKILIAVALIIVVLVIDVAMRPADFRVTRSATVGAPAERVFPQVNELKKWEAWSPWAKLDPNAKTNHEGPAAGVGAGFASSGNKEVGEGRMTITECRTNTRDRFRLDFGKPIASTCQTEFTFKPDGHQTLVTWTMSGKNNSLAKAIGLFMDCDAMVGSQFEQGLASMKSLAEDAAK